MIDPILITIISAIGGWLALVILSSRTGRRFRRNLWKRLKLLSYPKKLCNGCDKKFRFGRVHQDLFYCNDCIKKKFKICIFCKGIVDELVSFKKQKLCKDCLEKNLKHCEGCGKKELWSNLKQFGDKVYCSPCYKKVYRYFDIRKIPFRKINSDSFEENPFKDFCGVEIECRNESKDYNCFKIDELTKLNFSQIEDQSINCGGVEFYSRPINGDKLLETITKFCDELKNKNYFVDRSCGLHIHIGVRRNIELLKKLYFFYYKFEEYFFNMLPKSRQRTSFCRKFDRIHREYGLDDIRKIKDTLGFKKLLYNSENWRRYAYDKYHDKRYCWINFHSIFHRGTLEIRNHSGTIEDKKINNWLLIHLSVLDFLNKKSLKEIDELPLDKEVFLSIFDQKLRDYIIERWAKFPHYREENFILSTLPIGLRRRR